MFQEKGLTPLVREQYKYHLQGGLGVYFGRHRKRMTQVACLVM